MLNEGARRRERSPQYPWQSVGRVGLFAGGAAVIGGAGIVVGTVRLVWAVLRGALVWPALVLGLVVAAIDGALVVVLPLRGVQRSREGKRRGAVMLFATAAVWLLSVLVVMGAGEWAWIRGAAALALVLVAAVLAVRALTERPERARADGEDAAVMGWRPLRAATGRRRALRGGAGRAGGAQAFSLPQPWKGMLSVLLLALAFVSAGSPMVWAFAVLLVGMECHDALVASDPRARRGVRPAP